MTSSQTAAVEIETVDLRGRSVPVFHGAMCTFGDAFKEISRVVPAPVNQSVRRRVEEAGGGAFSIDQFDVRVAVVP
jgi:hypothetical protein